VLVEMPRPFDFALTLERFRAFGSDPANLWQDGVFRRVLGGVAVRLEPAPGGVRVEPPRPALAEPVRRFLGAPFDLAGFELFAAGDPVLSRLVEELHGLRPALLPDPFEMLVTSITAQQISLRAALAMRRRLVERYARPLDGVHPFPNREALARAEPEELVALGFSGRKAHYVVGIARSRLDLEGLGQLADEEVVERLTALPGIGRWTAEWFLARHLGRPAVWPAGDLGVRKAVSAFYLGGRDVSIEEARAFGERFGPWRTLAAHYLLVGLRVP
jgi:DNA-3-methyladenine glycosylase II